MPIKFTDNLLSRTYKDDFNDSNNYHRVLFNSGKALQARELTQMQTIIQREIETFGRNIFKEGANVSPAGVTLNTRYEFIKLDISTNTLPLDTSSMIGVEFEGNDSQIKVVILEVVKATASDPATLYIRYTDTTGGTPGATPVRMTAGEDLIAASIGITLTAQATNTTANPAVGVGTRVSIDKSSFFTQGHFVFAEKQSILLGKYTELPTAVVGFKVQQDVVTADDTEALFDNQGTTPNRSAPGADRYRIKLILTTEDLVDSDENFVYFCRVINGNVFDVVQGNNQYAAIEDRMALRTNELHGNFLVDPFLIHHEDDSDDGYLQTVITPGTAYVRGYRAHRDYTTRIRIPRAQETISLNNEVAAASYGNYIIVNNILGIPDIGEFQSKNLYDATGATGNVIGNARVRSVQEDGATYRFYLFDIKLNANISFTTIRSIGTSAADTADIVLENAVAILHDQANNNLFFALPNSRPKTLSDISLEVQRQFIATLDGTGAATLTLTASGETFTNTSDWIIINNVSGAVITPTVAGVGTQVASISGGPVSTVIRILGKVNKAAASVRSKSMVETTISSLLDSDSAGNKFLSLSKPDLYKLDRLRDSDSNGLNLLSDFIVDNGQRDNWYAPAKLFLKGDKTAPSGNVFARFRYFSHGASGDFFAAQSYSGQVAYGDIPSHTTQNGQKVQLRDILDFRPRSTDSGNSFELGGSRINELPENTDLIQADAEYYLPRYDIVTIDIDGVVRVKQGRSDLNPKYPPISLNEMNLANVEMDAFTINDSDIRLQLLESKKYSMRDIGELADKIEDLQELTALTLLETNLQNLSVFDGSGNDRIKAGFLVDNFQDQLASSFDNGEYRAAIDPQEKVLRPGFKEESLRLLYDSDLSTNTILKGDNVYTKYTDVSYIDQLQVSGIMNINPFNVITNIGHMTLSPASDEWRETQFAANRVVSGGTQNSFSGSQNQLFNSSQWNWAGTQVGATRAQGLGTTNQSFTSTSTGQGAAGNWRATAIRTTNVNVSTTTTAVARVASFSTIRRVVGDRVVDVALIPFMRSRRISFKAEGMKPNTRLWPFFDGTDVSNWVRSQNFTRIAANAEEVGNRFDRSTGIPEGATTLYTDGEGTVEGEFLIANTAALRFRTGSRELKLLDISSNDEDFATSFAVTPFTSSGVLETRQRTIQSTRVRNIATNTSSRSTANSSGSSTTTTSWNVATGERRVNGVQTTPPRTVRQVDPLAQSFFIPDQDGVFITKMDIFFQSKDDVIPVQMQLRPLVNGHPSSDDIVPGSVIFKSATTINVSADASLASTFTFDEPVYLLPYQEYAVVLIAETDAYNVYVAEAGEFILNSTEKRITSQPSLGSLFKSQNTSTWTPDQTRDLMFRAYRADFNNDTLTAAVMRNIPAPLRLLPEDPIRTINNSTTLEFNHPDHGFTTGDRVRIYGLDSTGTYASIKSSSITGERFIVDYDNDFFTVNADSDTDSNSATRMGGLSVETNQQTLFEEVWPYIETNLPQSTSIAASGKFASGQSIAGSEVRYGLDQAFIPLSLSARNQFLAPRIIMSTKQEQLNLPVGQKSATISVDMQSDTPYVSPVLDMQRASLWLTHNRIDNPGSVEATNINKPLLYVAETDQTGGTTLAKHITRPVTLAASAVGLKVILAANRPSTSDFKLYYKAINDDVNFDEVVWTEVVKEDNLPTDDDPRIFRDYEYVVGGDAGLSVPFTRFIFKLTMTTYNNAKVPSFKDLRVIALAV
jgi:hypothetical protein|tara:strand:+ start:20075 stop:25291 length:5217 start_codon:yes stop_codon:yes gene_type:complete